jgi:hypothetical protein
MKGMYCGNEDWLSRQRWIPIVLVAIAVIGGWAAGSQRRQTVADNDAKVQLGQPVAEKPQAPRQATPEGVAPGTPAPHPAGGAKVQTISAVQSQPTTATATANRIDNGSESLGNVAKRRKQREACLELAKDNPTIQCK